MLVAKESKLTHEETQDYACTILANVPNFETPHRNYFVKAAEIVRLRVTLITRMLHVSSK